MSAVEEGDAEAARSTVEQEGPRAVGLWIALASAACFGTSGTFAKSLFDAGWSPGAAVTARIGGAALVLSFPAVLALRGRWRVLRRHAGMLTVYGLVAMAACQLFYFQAVTRLSVGVALLLEYLAPVLLIGWLWLGGTRPSRLTLIGSCTSIAGLFLVLDIAGAVDVDLVGVAWGLGAAVSVVVYFVLSARRNDDMPPLVMAAAGMVVAAVALLVLGLVGLMPLTASTRDVAFMDLRVSWFVPVVGLVVVSTSIAYTSGITSTRRLGSRLGAFVGLTEVLFAVLFAWLFLDELPLPAQLTGGALIVVGIGCVRYDELLAARRTHPAPR